MDYINNSYNIELEANETIGYSVDSDTWVGWMAYTPEYFVYNDGQRTGLSFCSFKEGIPYFHNLSTETTYDIFYGIQTDQVIAFVCNESPQTEKRFQTITIDSKNLTSNLNAVKYIGNEVTTSDNQLSSIPITSWKFRENLLRSVFYRATNQGKDLATGDGLHGCYLEVRLVRDTDPLIQPTYSQFSKATVFFITSSNAIT